MTIRLTLIFAVALTGAATVLTHHDKRPDRELLAASALPVQPLSRAALSRASRGERRLPLRVKPTPRPRSHPRVIRSGSHLHDVTMYCPTGSRNAAGRWPKLGDVAVMDRSIPFGTRVLIAGNVYYVEDWIGASSEFDIFGGNDAGCEQRALNFGRRHLPVVIER